MCQAHSGLAGLERAGQYEDVLIRRVGVDWDNCPFEKPRL